MSDPAHDHGDLHPDHRKTYMKVFFALLFFTIVEYYYAAWLKDAFLALVVGLMTVAVVKATLVGMYFMHLKYEGKWVFAMLIPAGILAFVLVALLYPDMTIHPEVETGGEEDEEVATAPLDPSTKSRRLADSPELAIQRVSPERS